MTGCGGGSEGGTTAGSDAGTTPERQQLQNIRLSLEGYADAENVGVLIADQHGYFADVGLNVAVLDPVVSDNVPAYIAQGADQVGFLPQPQVAIAQDKGMPLVAIGSVVSTPTMALIWPKESKVEGVADLEGKTVAINGLSFEKGFLEVLLGQAGLTRNDVKIKSLAYGLVPALVGGRVDAILGSGNGEGVELEGRGMEPVVTPLRKLGIPFYEELVAVTRRDRLSRDPEWIHAFMAALTRGNATAVADPEAAVEAIAIARSEEGAPGPQQSTAKVEATLPLLSRTGRMSSGRAARLVDWMVGQGLLGRHVPVPALLTNRYVR